MSTGSPTSPESLAPARLASALKQPIVFDGTATPVKTALFVVLCLAWLVPGLIGHDPWKPDEAIAFGVIHQMLESNAWLVPRLVDTWYLDAPPFAAWCAAALATLLAPVLPWHDGARLASGLWIAAALWALGVAAMRATEPRAGRLSALFLIGSLGLLLRGHEISLALPPLAGTALVALGTVSLLKPEHAKHAGWWLGLGGAIVSLTSGLVPALVVLTGPLLLAATRTVPALTSAWRALVLAVGLTLLAASLWPALLLASGQGGLQPWLPAILGVAQLKIGGREFDVLYFTRILPWYALPALPVALWLWWKDRKLIAAQPALSVPLSMFLGMLVGFSLVLQPRDDMALPLLIPLVLAAVQAIDRLPRGLASFIDWFGLVFFFLLALMLWSGWTGAATGIPTGAAKWVAKQAPGYLHEIHWVSFALALALTLVWIYAALSARRSNRRAIVNWAAGITLIWVLTNLLWLPAIDHVRSYRGTALALRAALPDSSQCVAQVGLGDAQRAAFHYHAKLKFQSADPATGSPCPALLVQGGSSPSFKLESGWVERWSGARPGDRSERFRLYVWAPS